jgi:hypothetical protein
MKMDNLYSTIELIYAIFMTIYNNIFVYNDKEDVIEDIVEDVVFNDIYQNTIKSDYFENNNVNRNSLKINNLSEHKETKDNTMNLSKQSVDKELFSGERSSKENISNDNNESINFNDIYNKENDKFWNQYYQSET